MRNITSIVAEIIRNVQKQGDLALIHYAREFDRVALRPHELKVSASEIKAARDKVAPGFLKTIAHCAKNIQSFALIDKKMADRNWIQRRGNIKLGQLTRPVDSAGLYIPGGRFPYPSTVLMTAIPARVAGVKRVIMMSPPCNLTPEVLVAASFAQVDEVYRIGGAGAIAAMAYGTDRVRPVDLIVGPGNRYVTEAKRQVFGTVGIDLLAGPSEVVIIADETTPIDYIETDLCAQAEHDPEARAILISTHHAVLNQTRKRFKTRLRGRVQFMHVRSLQQAFEKSNEIAPEHLELLIAHADKYLSYIKHAGAIFLGPATPAALGDYVAGSSHVLPTQRAGHFSSGLSVATFLKRSSVIGYQGQLSERADWEAALTMAETEGMEYHAKSLRNRISSTK